MKDLSWDLKSQLFRVLLAFIALWVSISSHAQVTSNASWSDSFLDSWQDRISARWDNAANALGSTIWEAITDIDTRHLEFPGIDSDHFAPGMGYVARRRIFDNQNILNTFTVVDFQKTSFALPIQTQIPLNIAQMQLRMKLTTAIELDSINIRQVLPAHLTRLPEMESLEQHNERLQQEIERMQIDEENSEEEASDDGDQGMEEVPDLGDDVEVSSAPEQDVSDSRLAQRRRERSTRRRARWNNLHNLLFNAYRIPLTDRGIRRLEENEIISYGIDGIISLDISVGWHDLSLQGGDELRAGLNFGTYLKGRYQISVWKKSDHLFALKLTRSGARGIEVGLGARERLESFEGFMLGSTHIGRIRHTLIPFSFSMQREHMKSFDVIYEFDIRHPEALDAFKKGLRGKLKKAGELSQNHYSGVEWISSRTQQQTTRTSRVAPRLFLVYRAARQQTLEVTQATITTPDGRHFIVEGLTENLNRFDTIFGNRRLKRYRYNVFQHQQEGSHTVSTGMNITADIQDSRTYSDEMYEYVREVELATGISWPQDRIPEYHPNPHCEKFRKRGRMGRYQRCQNRRKSKAQYGTSVFHYRLSFNENQLNKFIHFPEERMWEIIEQGFGLPAGRWSSRGRRFVDGLTSLPATLMNIVLGVANVRIKRGYAIYRARRFFRRWKSLKHETEFIEQVETLGKMFKGHNFNSEFIKIMRLVFQDEQIAFLVRARNNRSFGHVDYRSGNTRAGRLVRDLQTAIDFEDPSSLFRLNEDLIVRDFRLRRLSEDEIKIKFYLPLSARYLFIGIDQGRRFRRMRSEAKLVLSMGEEGLSKGYHEFVVHRNDVGNSIPGQLAPYLFETLHQRLNIALRTEQGEWGPVSTAILRLPKDMRPDDDE